MSRFSIGLGLVLASGIALMGLAYQRGNADLSRAWQEEISNREKTIEKDAETVSRQIESVYQNLRTISLFPSVRNIDRHAKNLSEDARASIQQIYNNLASTVAVSEVYILPAQFNPERIDPETGKLEEPVIMFDELVVSAGKFSNSIDPFQAKQQADSDMPHLPEVEIHEYRQMQEQIAWFRLYYPDTRRFSGMVMPLINSEQVITCDNTEYVKTLQDKDRMGVVFSLPIYSASGKLNGMVSAVIRINALEALINKGQQWLQSPTGALEIGKRLQKEAANSSFVPSLLSTGTGQYSHVERKFSGHDPRGAWKLEAPLNAAEFMVSDDVRSIQKITGLLVATLAALTAIMLFWLLSLKRRALRLQHDATHDRLTGVPNRQLLEVVMAQSIALAGRGTHSALLYIDLDGFKSVNDSLGHQVGDAVIRAVTAKINSCIRASDLLARVGGDEFVVLLNGAGKTAVIMTLAQRIIEAVSQPFEVEGRPIQIGASIGVSLIDGSETDQRAIVRKADLALYRVKTSEKGTYRFYSSEMDAEREKRMLLEADLREALARKEFFLVYQPVVDAASETMTGAEALLRWNNPRRGLVPPSDFVPLAEETGLINSIGLWVLEQACQDAAQFPAGIKIAVNVSAVQFRNPSFGLQVVGALQKSGLHASQLEIEITETVLLSKDAFVHATLAHLRDLGVRLALDDFGTGYSSLNYLRQYDFDKVKIDRSFIASTSSRRDQEIFRAIATLGKTLGMVTTVEGVETPEQFKRVQETGCNEVQGFYFSKPVRAEELFNTAKNNQQKQTA